MDNESSDESHEEFDNDVEPEEADPEDEPLDTEQRDGENGLGQGQDDAQANGGDASLSDELVPRTEVVEAEIYDIVPTIAAPHSTSINTLCSTPDLQWVFSGGSDGYIRKFNWRDTIGGKSMLTVAQRHPFVDSVTKAGVLNSYWPNSDASTGKAVDDIASLSPVYSLAVEKHALWLLSGLEGGGINLQSVRHDEGKRIMTLRGHTSAVSVLNLAKDEQSFLSGSWDKNVLDWDLNTGKTTRIFEGSTGQISALEMRPNSSIPVREMLEDTSASQGGGADDDYETKSNGFASAIKDSETPNNYNTSNGKPNDTAGSPADSLFGGNDADSLFGETENMAAPGAFDDDENDFSRAIASDLQENEQARPAMKSQDPDADVLMEEAKEAEADKKLKGEAGVDSEHSPNLTGRDANQQESPDKNGPDNVAPLLATEANQRNDVEDSTPDSGSVFLAASIDGSIRVWDKRQRPVVAKLKSQNVPPWCMNACWSPDGNVIYAGRRNGTVDEYNIHKGLGRPTRNFKLPNNSGAVSAVKAMPNGRHLICASYDILRLYDLQEKQIFKHATVPFLIIPGHRTSIVSQLFIDPTARYLISAAGNRGWEGMSSEVLLGYEINVPS